MAINPITGRDHGKPHMGPRRCLVNGVRFIEVLLARGRTDVQPGTTFIGDDFGLWLGEAPDESWSDHERQARKRAIAAGTAYTKDPSLMTYYGHDRTESWASALNNAAKSPHGSSIVFVGDRDAVDPINLVLAPIDVTGTFRLWFGHAASGRPISQLDPPTTTLTIQDAESYLLRGYRATLEDHVDGYVFNQHLLYGGGELFWQHHFYKRRTCSEDIAIIAEQTQIALEVFGILTPTRVRVHGLTEKR